MAVAGSGRPLGGKSFTNSWSLASVVWIERDGRPALNAKEALDQFLDVIVHAA
jgi:hypothetical protein